MGKFYFYYGTMGAGKTAIAINKAYEFSQRNKKVYAYLPDIVWKSELRSRDGRVFPISKELIGDLHLQMIEKNSIVIVDEAQFLKKEAIVELKKKTMYQNVMVFCFGLLTDFKKRLFPTIPYLLAAAETIREIPCMCEACERKAQYNYRINENEELVVLDQNQYKSLCAVCYDALQPE